MIYLCGKLDFHRAIHRNSLPVLDQSDGHFAHRLRLLHFSDESMSPTFVQDVQFEKRPGWTRAMLKRVSKSYKAWHFCVWYAAAHWQEMTVCSLHSARLSFELMCIGLYGWRHDSSFITFEDISRSISEPTRYHRCLHLWILLRQVILLRHPSFGPWSSTLAGLSL